MPGRPPEQKGLLAAATSLPADHNRNKYYLSALAIVLMSGLGFALIFKGASAEIILAIAGLLVPIGAVTASFVGFSITKDGELKTAIVQAESAVRVEAIKSGATGDIHRTGGGL